MDSKTGIMLVLSNDASCAKSHQTVRQAAVVERILNSWYNYNSTNSVRRQRRSISVILNGFWFSVRRSLYAPWKWVSSWLRFRQNWPLSVVEIQPFPALGRSFTHPPTERRFSNALCSLLHSWVGGESSINPNTNNVQLAWYLCVRSNIHFAVGNCEQHTWITTLQFKPPRSFGRR